MPRSLSASLVPVSAAAPSIFKTQGRHETRHVCRNIFFGHGLQSALSVGYETPRAARVLFMQEITQLLKAAADGDRKAADAVVAGLYEDLRRLASQHMRRSGDLTLLDTTALVHEAWLRVLGTEPRDFPDRRHFLAYAARAMRTVVIDLVRARRAERRGGGAADLTLNTEIAELTPQGDDDILRVHEALEELAQVEPRLAQVVEMRYFGGMLEQEIAAALGVTDRTVQRDWQKARLFLAMNLKT